MTSKITIHDRYDSTSVVTLFEGDCLSLLGQIPDEEAQLVISSPPYFMGIGSPQGQSLSEYLAEQNKVVSECKRVLKDGGSLCYQVGWYVKGGEVLPMDNLLCDLIRAHGLRLNNRIVWHFESGQNGFKRFSGRHEVVLWFRKGKVCVFNLEAIKVPRKHRDSQMPTRKKNPGDVWLIPKSARERTGHPTQYPVALAERLILALTNPGDLVVDPFLGSGTTAIAALLHNRRCAGAEREGKYIEITKKRLRNLEEGTLKYQPLSSLTDKYRPQVSQTD